MGRPFGILPLQNCAGPIRAPQNVPRSNGLVSSAAVLRRMPKEHFKVSVAAFTVNLKTDFFLKGWRTAPGSQLRPDGDAKLLMSCRGAKHTRRELKSIHLTWPLQGPRTLSVCLCVCVNRVCVLCCSGSQWVPLKAPIEGWPRNTSKERGSPLFSKQDLIVLVFNRFKIWTRTKNMLEFNLGGNWTVRSGCLDL